MTTIYFVRHGEYKNPNNILPLRTPGIELSEKGIHDIQKLGGFFKNLKNHKEISAIYTSPILRCMQTSEILGEILQIQPKKTEQLIELDSPKFQGLSLDKFKKIIGDEILVTSQLHLESGGESDTEVTKRMRAFIAEALTFHSEKCVIACSHGDPIMNIALAEQGIKYTRENLNRNGIEYIQMGEVMEMRYEGKTFVGTKHYRF
jgi:2,3-bisphosphoglycerate-dependent phosphoglycerate mutase